MHPARHALEGHDAPRVGHGEVLCMVVSPHLGVGVWKGTTLVQVEGGAHEALEGQHLVGEIEKSEEQELDTLTISHAYFRGSCDTQLLFVGIAVGAISQPKLSL